MKTECKVLGGIRVGDQSEDVTTIKDSGERRLFESGAVRDMASKGRCDLLPWSSLPGIMEVSCVWENDFELFCISMQNATHALCDEFQIRIALKAFVNMAYDGCMYTALLEAAYHYEAGAKKYSARNWEAGIPVTAFLDSAGRHFLKYMRCDKDEAHNRAVVWNLLCAIWTVQNRPEMIAASIDGVKA